MERLTKKVKHNTYRLDKVKSLAVKRKLGQLEDIEQELGIELSVLFNDRYFKVIVANYLKELEFIDKFGFDINAIINKGGTIWKITSKKGGLNNV